MRGGPAREAAGCSPRRCDHGRGLDVGRWPRDRCRRGREHLVSRRERARVGGSGRIHRPQRLLGHGRHLRAHHAHRRGVRSRRSCVREREERIDQGLRLAVGHHADRLRRPAYPGAQLPGSRRSSASRSTPSSRPGRTCTCSTPTTRSPAAPRPGGARRAAPATAARTRPAPPPTVASSQARLSRLTASGNQMSGAEQVLVERLVPAVPQPLHRHRQVRPGRGAVRGCRRRVELQLRRLRPDQERLR